VAFPRTAYVELMSTGGKTLSNASQEKHLAVSLRRRLYPVGGFY